MTKLLSAHKMHPNEVAALSAAIPFAHAEIIGSNSNYRTQSLMTKEQAGGYLFEYVVREMLRQSGFVDVSQDRLEGRGAYHQIDAFGTLHIPTPFVHPIRLICEAKWYKKKIGLPVVRNFVGVIKDISENYWFRKKDVTDRFTDSGCIFSLSSFSRDAQDYAWAQNIFLVSFSGVNVLSGLRQAIDGFLKNNVRLWRGGTASKDELLKEFHESFLGNFSRDTSLVVGTLDGIYPVIIAGKKELIGALRNAVDQGTFKLVAIKTFREAGDGYTTFNADIDLGRELTRIEFCLPNALAKRLIRVVKKSVSGDKIFFIDVPVVIPDGEDERRAIVRIDVLLPVDEKNDYFASLRLFKSGSILRSRASGRLYWVGNDGKRYLFPNVNVLNSWFPDIASRPEVQLVSEAQLDVLPLGGNVVYRSGSRLLRMGHDTKIHAIANRGIIRWVSSDAVATAIYGVNWRDRVETVSEEYVPNYVIGSSISSKFDFNPEAEEKLARLP